MFELSARIRWLRWLTVAQLALMVVQYEVGIVANISAPFPHVSPTGFSVGIASQYIAASGAGLVLHAVLGVVLFVNSVLVVILPLPVTIRWFRIVNGIAAAFVFSALFGGLFFRPLRAP